MDFGRTLSRKHSQSRPNKKARISPPASRAADSEDSDLDGSENDAVEEKDETEQKLESLVFGDQTGFHDALKTYDRKSIANLNVGVPHSRDYRRGDGEESDSGGSTDSLAGLADEDVSLTEPSVA